MGATELIIIVTFASVAVALIILGRRSLNYRLRPISAYQALRHEPGMAVESGRHSLLALGNGQLHTQAGPASIAGLFVLQRLAQASGQGLVAPRATVGASTVLPIALDHVRTASEENPEQQAVRPDSVQFLAEDTSPFTYAAGTADVVERKEAGNSIAIGRFGAELAIIAEASARGNVRQIMGSDDLSAIAVATASTENSLWGEEIFAAGAYLNESASSLAPVRVQDVLRWLVILALLVTAVLHLLGLT